MRWIRKGLAAVILGVYLVLAFIAQGIFDLAVMIEPSVKDEDNV